MNTCYIHVQSTSVNHQRTWTSREPWPWWDPLPSSPAVSGGWFSPTETRQWSVFSRWPCFQMFPGYCLFWFVLFSKQTACKSENIHGTHPNGSLAEATPSGGDGRISFGHGFSGKCLQLQFLHGLTGSCFKHLSTYLYQTSWNPLRYSEKSEKANVNRINWIQGMPGKFLARVISVRFHESLKMELANDPVLDCRRVKATNFRDPDDDLSRWWLLGCEST